MAIVPAGHRARSLPKVPPVTVSEATSVLIPVTGAQIAQTLNVWADDAAFAAAAIHPFGSGFVPSGCCNRRDSGASNVGPFDVTVMLIVFSTSIPPPIATVPAGQVTACIANESA